MQNELQSPHDSNSSARSGYSSGSSNKSVAVSIRNKMRCLENHMEQMKRKKYATLVKQITQNVVRGMAQGKRTHLHMFYKYPVAADGVRSLFKLVAFLTDKSGMQCKPVHAGKRFLHKGKRAPIGIKIRCKSAHGVVPNGAVSNTNCA